MQKEVGGMGCGGFQGCGNSASSLIRMKGAESSWGLSAAVSRYISDKIYSLLQPYLENIIIDAQVGLKPEVTLTDIMLREDALDHFALPLRVSKQSRVSLLKISLPLTSFNTDPVTVD
jgi:hypothetical protein